MDISNLSSFFESTTEAGLEIQTIKNRFDDPQFNPMFRSGLCSQFNACVGDNGFPGIFHYADGFADAALALIKAAVEEQMLVVDTIIYPIGFNIRHSTELYLKSFCSVIKKIRPLKGATIPEEIRLTEMHDLGILWNYCEKLAASRDYRISTALAPLKDYVIWIAEVDKTGQTFRYPYHTSQTKHLVEVGIINLVELGFRFDEFYRLLKEKKYLFDYLSDEYATKTYTNCFSRGDLVSIADRLPEHSYWSRDGIACIRDQFVQEYQKRFGRSLSNNDFNKAVLTIKSHYSLAPMIGLKVPLKGSLTKEDVQVAFELNQHFVENLHEQALSTWEEERKLKQEITDKLTQPTLWSLSALFESSSATFPAEDYVYSYKLFESNPNMYDESHWRSLKRSNFSDNVKSALHLFGYGEWFSE